MNPFLAAGFTGVAVVWLAAVSYSLQVSLDRSTSHPGLTASFIAINLAGWVIGARLHARDRRSPLGLTLLLLGDSIFPVGIYAPVFLYLPGFQGSAAASASLILALGVCYHLARYLRIESSYFHPSFYPYFFAMSGVALLQLTRATTGVPAPVAHLMSLAFLTAYYFVGRKRSLQPLRDFVVAPAVGALFTALVAAVDVAILASRPALLTLFVTTVLLFAQTLSHASLGPACRAIGAAAYLSLTLFLTGCLRLAGAPPVFYVIATAIWVAILAALGTRFRIVDALRESAHWLAASLGLGLAVLTWPTWGALLDLGGSKLVPFLGDLPQVPTALALIAVALALIGLSYWRGRNPTIAMSIPGFIAGVAFLNITTFTGPSLFVVGIGALASAFIPGIAVLPIALLAVFAIMLLIARRLEESYPMTAIDVAAIASVFLAAWNARADTALAAAVYLIGAALLLWRSRTGSGMWSYLAFLTLATLFAAFLATSAIGLALALLSIAVLVVSVTDDMRRPETMFGLLVAIALGIGAIGIAAWGDGSLAVFGLVWLGLHVGLHGLRLRVGANADLGGESFDALSLVGHGVAHLAGALFVVFVVKGAGLAPGVEGLALAAWAWLHLAVLRLLPQLAAASFGRATGYALPVFAAGSIILALVPGGLAIVAVCALSWAALCITIAPTQASHREALMHAGTAFTVLAIGASVAAGGDVPGMTLAGGAAVYLWRSTRERLFAPHVAFLVLGSLAAVVVTFTHRSILGALPLTVLALSIVFASRSHRALDGLTATVRVSLAWALGVAALALFIDLAVAPRLLAPLVVLWLGLFASFTSWPRLGAADWESGGSDGDWPPQAGFWLSHAAGVAVLWRGLDVLGVPEPPRVAALAVLAAVLTGLLHMSGRWLSRQPQAAVTRQASYVLSALTLLLAAFHAHGGIWIVGACLVIAGLLTLCFKLFGRVVFAHAAAIAMSEALVVLGVSAGVLWLDYYLLCGGLYLCLLIARARPAERVRVGASPFQGLPPIFDARNVLPAVAVLLMSGYPFVALTLSLDEIHLAFLAVATMILLWVFVPMRAHPLLVYLVCTLLLLGVTLVAAIGDAGPALWLVLLAAATMIIANLKRAGNVDERLTTGGSQ